MKTYVYLPILSAFLLAGCGLRSTYQRPDNLPVEGLYRESSLSSDSSLATLSWNELFTDPHLAHWIEVGLRENSDLQVALLQVEEASAQLSHARQSYLPSLDLTPQGKISSYDGAKPTRSYSLGVEASWEVDLFGRLRNAHRKTKALLLKSQAYRQAVESSLIATIAESYYSLLMLDAQLEITRRTVVSWEANLRALTALKRAGEKNEAAILQAKANRLSAESSALALEEEIHRLENSFSILLGMTPQAIARSKQYELDLPAQLHTGIPLEMLNRRPDVRQAELTLAQAFYATGEARSCFYPRVTLSGSAGWTHTGGAGISNPGSWLLTALGSLVQPLYNQGQLRAQLRIAKAQQQEALLQYRQAILQAGGEVNDALTQVQTARQHLQLDEQRIHTLEQTVHTARLLMKHSHSTYLEVLTAEQNLLQAKLEEVSHRYLLMQGVIALYHALGGGFP